MLMSLVSEVGSPHVTIREPATEEQQSSYICDDIAAGLEDDGELLRLEQHHEEWKKQMEFLLQRGQQLEDAFRSGPA